MPEQTEAACLLTAGTAYRKRLLLHPGSGGEVFIGVKAGGFSLYRGDEPIFHFDFEGRWQRSFVDGTHYLKGLDTSIRSVERVREGETLVLRRRTLSEAALSDLDVQMRHQLLDLLDILDRGDFRLSERAHDARPLTIEEARMLLRRSASWDCHAWRADRDLHRSTYGPLPFIPPTCSHPLILQAGLGPGFGRAGGGGPRPRTLGQFEEHARTVGSLLGRRLAGCRDIFLDGLDWLGRPPEEVLEIVQATVRLYPLARHAARSVDVDEEARPLVSIQAMLDDFPESRPRPGFWSRLRDLGLKHLSLGIESGDPAIRAAFGKSWRNPRLGSVVEDLREAGIGCDLVLLAGTGGADGANSHIEATGALIDSLPPAKGRRIYLVDARSFDGAPTFDGHLSDPEMFEQTARLKARLLAKPEQDRPTVIVYNADKQSS